MAHQWETRLPPELARWPYTSNDFARMDESPDAQFYSSSRLVTHIDDNCISWV
jgi:hypothetical protein